MNVFLHREILNAFWRSVRPIACSCWRHPIHDGLRIGKPRPAVAVAIVAAEWLRRTWYRGFEELETALPDSNDIPAAAAGPAKARPTRSLRPLARLLPFVLQYKAMMVLALVALTVASAATLAVPLAVRRMIDLGFSRENS